LALKEALKDTNRWVIDEEKGFIKKAVARRQQSVTQSQTLLAGTGATARPERATISNMISRKISQLNKTASLKRLVTLKRKKLLLESNDQETLVTIDDQ